MRRKGLSAIFGGVVVAAIGVMLALVSLAPAAAVGSDEARLASATFTVDSEVDAVDVEPGDGVCATAEGACSLRAAVMEANSLPGADHVVVPSGTYSVSIPTSAGVPDDPAASGDIDIIDELVITGAGSEETVLKGPGGERGWSVLNVSAGVSATLEALQVREGSGALGGGISNDGALTLRETAVVSNTSVLGGGLTSRGRLEVHGGRIALNVSESGGGVVFEPTEAGTEALFVDAEITGNGPAGVKCAGWGGVVLNDSRIVSNTIGVDSAECAVIAVGSRVEGSERQGIGAYSGFVTVADGEVVGNGASAGDGGGLIGTGALLRVLRSTIAANGGSGIADRNKGEVIVADSTIISNTSAYGGGVGMSNQGELTMVRSTVAGNMASHGGGIYVGNGGRHYVENSTISANHASNGGNLRNGGELTLVNTTLLTTVGEGRGIGINNSGTLVLESCVLDVEPQAISCAPGSDLISGGSNVSADDTCGLDATGDIADLENVDPLIGSLADNGGWTQTHALLEGSPAIDQGGEFGCPDTDQRGVERPQGAGCDSGAFESGADAPPVPTPDRDFDLSNVRVFGYAVDAADGETPIVGAEVTVHALPGACASPAATDERGFFDTECGSAHLLGGIVVELSADGYNGWRGSYALGPLAADDGPISVAAELTRSVGPTATPSPEPSATPDHTPRGAYVPAAYRGAPVR